MTEYISRMVGDLVKQYATRDPYQLAEDLEVEVLFHPLGEYLKGYFFYQSRVKVIVINSDLPEEMQRVVCAHELGHSILHKDLAMANAVSDLTLFDKTARPEFEANLFASELLIPDEDVIRELNEDKSFFHVAGELMVPPELLDFKFRLLKHKGYRLEAPLDSCGDFMKH